MEMTGLRSIESSSDVGELVTILEALKIIQKTPPADTRQLDVSLACGFTPLHLETFLKAHLAQAFPDRAVHLNTGLFGDLFGNIERIAATRPDASFVLVEWEDLDPRLGIRRPGDWSPSAYSDIVDSACASVARLRSALEQIQSSVALSLTTLPFPPIGHYPGWQAHPLQARIRESLASFEWWACSTSNIRVLSSERLDQISPASHRYDVSGYILNGFPYTLTHAAAIAELLTLLVHNAPPKKGLITDLDDTLWAGLVGEIGPDAVSWDLDHRSHMHGFYQQFLSALAAQGVLIGVASKNSPAVVERAFQRKDLLLKPDSVWPIQVQWSVKSEAVSRILQAWNIGPESVVFVDDSAMELAEVKAAHPAIECLAFEGEKYELVYGLIGRLRDLFGKTAVSNEDALRLASLRASAAVRETSQDSMTSDEFLSRAGAEIIFSFDNPPDARALELINKTNQFNLNGQRYTESDWQRSLSRPGTIVVVASYRDKYGPLGKILVLHGRVNSKTLFVDSWVLSCRAFSRRIEHHCIQELFQRFGIEEIQFDFARTERNGPTSEFFSRLLSREPEPGMRLTKREFEANCPQLFATLLDPVSA
jgi:FkbH-like protein